MTDKLEQTCAECVYYEREALLLTLTLQTLAQCFLTLFSVTVLLSTYVLSLLGEGNRKCTSVCKHTDLRFYNCMVSQTPPSVQTPGKESLI